MSGCQSRADASEPIILLKELAQLTDDTGESARSRTPRSGYAVPSTVGIDFGKLTDVLLSVFFTKNAQSTSPTSQPWLAGPRRCATAVPKRTKSAGFSLASAMPIVNPPHRRSRARPLVSLTQAGRLLLSEAEAAIPQLERAEQVGRLAAHGELGQIEVG
jgi:hypothetical protein